MSTILVDKWMVRAPTTLTMTLDWSAQQVLGSLCSYQDREEERLASPEVPGAGGLRHSTLLTAIWRPVLKWVLMRSTRGRDRGDSDTKARYTNARDSTWGHVRGPLVDCAVLLYMEGDIANGIHCVSDFQGGGAMVCHLPEVLYLCNLPLSL